MTATVQFAGIYLMSAGELIEYLSAYLEDNGWDQHAEDAFEMLVVRYQEGTTYRSRFECSLILRYQLSYAGKGVGVHSSLVTDLAERVK